MAAINLARQVVFIVFAAKITYRFFLRYLFRNKVVSFPYFNHGLITRFIGFIFMVVV